MQYIVPPKSTRWTDESNEDVPAGSVPCYDIGGNLLFQHSMDAGDRWMLMDAAGKPMLAWDFNEWHEDANVLDERRLYRTEYDAPSRPTKTWLSGWSRAHQTADECKFVSTELIERFEYQDAKPNYSDNLNGQVIGHFDASGRTETLRRDFNRNVEEVRRTLVSDPTISRIDWTSDLNPDGSSKLEAETYIQIPGTTPWAA